MKRLSDLLPAVVVMLAVGGQACATNAAAQSPPQPLTPAIAGAAALQADDAMRQALAAASPDGLDSSFGGRALAALRVRIGRMRQRHLELEERSTERRVLHVDVNAHEVILRVRAEHRLVGPDEPDPPWAATLRQWWVRLDFRAGRWLVTDEQDLPPDRWLLPTAPN